MTRLRILSVEVNGISIPISDSELNTSGSNFYTIIIGNNASGKSRLLVSMLNRLRQTKNLRLKLSTDNVKLKLLHQGIEEIIDDKNHSSSLSIDEINLVSISNSLFDKFPHKAKSDKNYSYIGSRMLGIGTHKRAIVNDLMDILSINLRNPNFVKKAKQLFLFLRLEPIIKISLRFSLIASRNRFDGLMENVGSVRKLKEYLTNISKQGFYRQQASVLERYTEDSVFLKGFQKYLKNNLKEFRHNSNKEAQSFEIDLNDSTKNETFIDEYIYFSLLRRLNILTYDFIKLKKGNLEYDLQDSSTGEIGLLITFLRAVPEMRSNSIIFIDEPEISLHPSWQMKYIDLLRGFISGYSNCHVIIATHSHLLLSDLKEEWSSVVVLNKDEDNIKGELKKYTPYGWSPEAILYDVFGVANVRNHYLEYDLKKMLSLISSRKGSPNQIKEYLDKLRQFEFKEGDPLHLIIKEAEEYAKKKSKPFLFQNLNGKDIKYTRGELKVINGLKPLVGGEWDGIIKTGCPVRRMDRDAVKVKIKTKLLKIQGAYCIYCGLHEKHCGQLEREHIAPKGTTHFPEFMFEPENLCLACHHCNFDLKRKEIVISSRSATYAKNRFTFVHPYFDDINLHIEFVAENGKAIIRKRPRSRKGKKTIELFELDTPENTEKRSGLLIVNELDFKKKYDSLLDAALNRKYVKA